MKKDCLIAKCNTPQNWHEERLSPEDDVPRRDGQNSTSKMAQEWVTNIRARKGIFEEPKLQTQLTLPTSPNEKPEE
jgi:hypothetical protein